MDATLTENIRPQRLVKSYKLIPSIFLSASPVLVNNN